MKYRPLKDDAATPWEEARERHFSHLASYEAMRTKLLGGDADEQRFDDEPAAHRAQARRRSDRSGLRFPKHQPYQRAEARSIPAEGGKGYWIDMERYGYGAGTLKDYGVYTHGSLPDGVEYHRDPDVAAHGGYYAKFLDNRKAA